MSYRVISTIIVTLILMPSPSVLGGDVIKNHDDSRMLQAYEMHGLLAEKRGEINEYYGIELSIQFKKGSISDVSIMKKRKGAPRYETNVLSIFDAYSDADSDYSVWDKIAALFKSKSLNPKLEMKRIRNDVGVVSSNGRTFSIIKFDMYGKKNELITTEWIDEDTGFVVARAYYDEKRMKSIAYYIWLDIHSPGPELDRNSKYVTMLISNMSKKYMNIDTRSGLKRFIKTGKLIYADYVADIHGVLPELRGDDNSDDGDDDD